MKTTPVLATIVATSLLNVLAQNTYSGLTCQTSGASPSATDLNDMGLALNAAPQSTRQYCSGDHPPMIDPNTCVTAAVWNTAAVNICGGTVNAFCIYGSDLGHWVQVLAITCRNGGNLSGGKVSVRGADGNTATVEVYHS